MNAAVLHFYRSARAHQMATYGNSGLHIVGVDQREFAGGGAAYGFHALAAYNSARGQVHFRATLAADNAAYKKRCKAAKKAAKTRKARAAA